MENYVSISEVAVFVLIVIELFMLGSIKSVTKSGLFKGFRLAVISIIIGELPLIMTLTLIELHRINHSGSLTNTIVVNSVQEIVSKPIFLILFYLILAINLLIYISSLTSVLHEKAERKRRADEAEKAKQKEEKDRQIKVQASIERTREARSKSDKINKEYYSIFEDEQYWGEQLVKLKHKLNSFSGNYDAFIREFIDELRLFSIDQMVLKWLIQNVTGLSKSFLVLMLFTQTTFEKMASDILKLINNSEDEQFFGVLTPHLSTSQSQISEKYVFTLGYGATLNNMIVTYVADWQYYMRVYNQVENGNKVLSVQEESEKIKQKAANDLVGKTDKEQVKKILETRDREINKLVSKQVYDDMNKVIKLFSTCIPISVSPIIVPITKPIKEKATGFKLTKLDMNYVLVKDKDQAVNQINSDLQKALLNTSNPDEILKLNNQANSRKELLIDYDELKWELWSNKSDKKLSKDTMAFLGNILSDEKVDNSVKLHILNYARKSNDNYFSGYIIKSKLDCLNKICATLNKYNPILLFLYSQAKKYNNVYFDATAIFIEHNAFCMSSDLKVYYEKNGNKISVRNTITGDLLEDVGNLELYENDKSIDALRNKYLTVYSNKGASWFLKYGDDNYYNQNIKWAAPVRTTQFYLYFIDKLLYFYEKCSEYDLGFITDKRDSFELPSVFDEFLDLIISRAGTKSKKITINQGNKADSKDIEIH